VYRYNTRTVLYNRAGTGSWRVNAMAAAKFGGDATAKLITAATVDDVQKIFRGDGTTAQSGSANQGLNNTAQPLYSNNGWKVTAMTAGVLSGSTPKLVTAFQWLGGSPLNRMYTGNGTTSATSTMVWEKNESWVVAALTIGKFATNPRLITAYNVNGGARVYSSNDLATTIDHVQLYSSASWDVTALAKARHSSVFSTEFLITAFDLSDKTEVWVGTGTQGTTDIRPVYRNPDPTL
jgi:hypothetical protein